MHFRQNINVLTFYFNQFFSGISLKTTYKTITIPIITILPPTPHSPLLSDS